MDPIIKQRLVGALVLLALGVVFWPIIFVEAPAPQMVVMEPMAPRPEIDTTPIEAPQSPEERISAALPKLPDQAEAQSQADAGTTIEDEPAPLDALPQAETLDPLVPRDEAPVAPTLDEEGLGVAWVLQVATVSAEPRADALRQQLQDKGYKAFVVPIQRGDDTLYRVQIGPKVERAKLEPIRVAIDRELAVESAILRYVQ